MDTKTSQAVSLFTSGNTVEALKIFKSFKIGFTNEERRIVAIAHESLTGHEEFYKSIQVDTATIKAKAIQIIKQKYNI